MAEAYKVLGQLDAAATTLETLYTVPAATEGIVTTLTVCNRGATNTTFRIAVGLAGAGIDNKQYIYYDVAIPANDTFAATLGITLETTDIFETYAGNGNLTFQIFGTEVT